MESSLSTDHLQSILTKEQKQKQKQQQQQKNPTESIYTGLSA